MVRMVLEDQRFANSRYDTRYVVTFNPSQVHIDDSNHSESPSQSKKSPQKSIAPTGPGVGTKGGFRSFRYGDNGSLLASRQTDERDRKSRGCDAHVVGRKAHNVFSTILIPRETVFMQFCIPFKIKHLAFSIQKYKTQKQVLYSSKPCWTRLPGHLYRIQKFFRNKGVWEWRKVDWKSCKTAEVWKEV
jgi:hypothetical protein